MLRITPHCTKAHTCGHTQREQWRKSTSRSTTIKPYQDRSEKQFVISFSLPLRDSAITEWRKNAWQCFAVNEAISNKQYKPLNPVADPSYCWHFSHKSKELVYYRSRRTQFISYAILSRQMVRVQNTIGWEWCIWWGITQNSQDIRDRSWGSTIIYQCSILLNF